MNSPICRIPIPVPSRLYHVPKPTPFEGYVSPETISKLLREGKPGIQPPQVRHFQFVVILVDDANPHDVPTMIEAVMVTLVRQHATVLNIASALLVGLLGVPFPEGNSPQARLDLVAALLQDNGIRVRVAHGECDGAVGMLGGHQRWTYGAVITGFSGTLKTLLETAFGTAIEIP